MAWKPADGKRRCVHKANRSGGQCKLWGVVGTEPPTCKVHGGSAPQVRAKAEQRVLQRRAGEIARKMDADVEAHGGDPMSALSALLERDAAMVARYEAAAEQHPDPSDKLARAVHDGYRAERDAAAKRIDLMVRSGVAGKLMELRQAQADKDTQATFGRVIEIIAYAVQQGVVTGLLPYTDKGVIPIGQVEDIAGAVCQAVVTQIRAVQRTTVQGEVAG